MGKQGVGSYRNEHCNCNSGEKFKKCHLPALQGFVKDKNGMLVFEPVLAEVKIITAPILKMPTKQDLETAHAVEALFFTNNKDRDKFDRSNY